MRLPNGETIMHAGRPYDPVKAHEYYLRTRKLKGRKKGAASNNGSATDSLKPQVPSAAKARVKKELAERINRLEDKLARLEKAIAKKEREAKSDARKSKAKKNRAAKEAAKPDTAAEKAKKARESKKYRDKNRTKLANKAKNSSGKSGGGSSKSSSATSSDSGTSVKELKTLATRVKGQLAVAKSKLRAL